MAIRIRMPVLRLCMAKANTVMDAAVPTRIRDAQIGRLYEKRHNVIGATARVRPPVGAHCMRSYGPIRCAAFVGIMQRGERGIREARFYHIKCRANPP